MGITGERVVEEHDGGRIKVVHGDIWETSMNVIVVPVNAKGVMGAGMAKEAAKRYPEECNAFTMDCKLDNGPPPAWTNLMFVHGKDVRLCMFTTKTHWKQASNMRLIRNGLCHMVKDPLVGRPSRSVAFPALGCGLGGLVWEDVKPLIVAYALLSTHPAVEIYEPV